MKKFLQTVILSVAVVGTSAAAQQLPNAGFQDNWGPCTPWTSNGNTKTQGTTPAPWTIAQVIGISGTGATIVGTQAEPGYQSTLAAKVYNNHNTVATNQKVPGYITLGTTWATSTGTGNNKDGGTFGGLEFAYRPDAVSFLYKRGVDASNDPTGAQPASVVAYLWKGQTSQANVPGNNVMLAVSLKKVTMVNRDRNILGMTTAQGGAVTKSADFALIATVNENITTINPDEWMPMVCNFKYESTTDIPTMFNIIFAANNYFDSENIKEGNSLTIDDVTLLYYSRLKSLTIDGKPVQLTDGVYEYEVESLENIEALSNGVSATVTVDKTADGATINVENVAADIDGKSAHTYTLVLKQSGSGEGKYETGAFRYVNGTLNVNMMGESLLEQPQEAQLKITYTSATTCQFLLPDLTLGELGTIGDIEVEKVDYATDASGNETYTGSVEGMKLLDGEIDADVTVTGTIAADNKADFKIGVEWVMDRGTTDEQRIPIDVDFSGIATSGVEDIVADNENAPVEYFNLNGVRVTEPSHGLYIRRQGSKATKVLVK